MNRERERERAGQGGEDLDFDWKMGGKREVGGWFN
jgi:hypothetical protein